jgi:UDP-2,3-diacylglucosamine pyrophosphatase LpxH
MINKPNYRKTLIVSDLHVPFQDKKAVKSMLAFSKWYKPNYIFLNGDIIDFYAISRFDKDPKRIDSLQDEINETVDFLTEFRNVNKKAIITYLRGNHEYRLIKYKWSQAKGLNSLDALKFGELLKLDKLNIDYQQSGRMKFGKTLIKHGDIVRQQSAYTARGEFERSGMSGVSGHTHRLGVHWKTNESGEYVWFEGGCLCDLSPEYMEGKTPDWQQGFIIGNYNPKNQLFNLDQVQIVEGRAMYGGMEFS